MAVVWIIEKSHTNQVPVAAGLLGDFAVRVFASFESMLRIAKLRGGAQPELVVVNVPSEGVDTFALDSVSKLAPAICLMGPTWSRFQENGFSRITSWQDDFDLTKQLKLLVGRYAKQTLSCKLTYKDLELDTEHFELSMPLSDFKESLPKKEALILKLLLQRPGECLSRQEIKTKVWSDLVVTARTIDCHVSRLRKRLAGSEASIQSVYGDGYILS